MALSGLDIYKLLPKTNCRDCGFPTCLAFAMQLAKKAVTIEKCPHLSAEARNALEVSAQPPIRLVSIGEGDSRVDIGNETVMFRHEEKFHHPCGIGFIIEDSLSDAQIKEKAEKINKLRFERVGQQLNVNFIGVRQSGEGKRFLEALKLILDNTKLAPILISRDSAVIKEALRLASERNCLVYGANKDNFSQLSEIVKEFKVPLVVSGGNLDELSDLSARLNSQGAVDLVLEIGSRPLAERIWDLTQIRRQALKKRDRSLGYPSLAVTVAGDPYEEAIEASAYISKYAGIVLLKNIESWEALALLTLRQNIYTDPQKPLQVEPKVYPVGSAGRNSPLIVTTNFSLTYYTVLGEVEASKIPAHILSVDTEGMSVLTAWAAEKFTPDKISDSLNKFAVADILADKKMIIPGYVAVMSGELEEKSGWKVIVGPKEAAGIPSFLKKL